MNVKVRFAPSPTGYLHVGGLRTALYNYLYAKNTGGKIILRIEDTDQSRKIKGSVQNLINSFKSMGIDFDEGPNIDGKYGPYYQSLRLEIYKKYIEKLIVNKKAYPCFCSSERLENIRLHQIQKKSIIKYDRHCLNLSQNHISDKIKSEKFVVRLRIPDNGEVVFYDQVRGKVKIKCEEIDDQVLIKADKYPTYHFANVIDDHLMKITHVIRGEEWLSSTPKHILIYKALNWDLPEFIHLPLLLNSDKSKLSKRQGDVSVEDFLKKGYLKEALINYVSLLGWHPSSDKEIFNIKELVEDFSIKRIQKSGAVFDHEKLKWMNKYYLKNLDIEQVINVANSFYDFSNYTHEKIKKLVEFSRKRITKLDELKDDITPFTNKIKLSDEVINNLKSKNIQNFFKKLLNEFENIKNWDSNKAKMKVMELGKLFSLQGKDLFFPVRTVLFGKPNGPDIVEILDILGKRESIYRIKNILV